jgi:DNA replication protein DnaC
MILNDLTSKRLGESNCSNCGGVGIYLDELISGSKTSDISLCYCVTEHCKTCTAKGKPPFLSYDETSDRMIPCYCHEARLYYTKLKKNIEEARIPVKYSYKFMNHIDSSSDQTMSILAAMDWATDLIKHWDNHEYWKNHPKRGMYLTGAPGSGKSLIACVILNELIFRYNIRCLYAKISKDFLSALKDTYQKDSEFHGQERSIEQEFADVDVLVVDDFGVQKESEWANAKLYDLIDSRYEREKITLLTSNLPLKDWKDKGLGRVYSRLTEMTKEIELLCSDYRAKLGNRN